MFCSSLPTPTLRVLEDAVVKLQLARLTRFKSWWLTKASPIANNFSEGHISGGSRLR